MVEGTSQLILCWLFCVLFVSCLPLLFWVFIEPWISAVLREWGRASLPRVPWLVRVNVTGQANSTMSFLSSGLLLPARFFITAVLSRAQSASVSGEGSWLQGPVCLSLWGGFLASSVLGSRIRNNLLLGRCEERDGLRDKNLGH